jgi:hypothetical protein
MEARVPLVLNTKRAQSAVAAAQLLRICIECCTSHWLVQCILTQCFLLGPNEGYNLCAPKGLLSSKDLSVRRNGIIHYIPDPRFGLLGKS